METETQGAIVAEEAEIIQNAETIQEDARALSSMGQSGGIDSPVLLHEHQDTHFLFFLSRALSH